MYSRIEKTKKNIYVDLISYFVTVLMRFVVRYVFICSIGTEFLGLNSTFTSIISMLSLAEMGFGTSVGAMLYKPLADSDTEKIKSIINITKKIFYIVALVILFCGLMVVPFLDKIISNTTISFSLIRIYYIIFVVETVISYLCTHKIVLITADQKQYVYKRIYTITNIFISIIQIAILLVLKNYLLFIIFKALGTILPNVITAKIVDKSYPYIKESNIQKLNSTERKTFFKQSAGLFCYKLGTVIVSATDNILISSSTILGVIVLGKYSNYSLIFTSITQLAYVCVSGAIASIGNILVTSDNKKTEQIFERLQFYNFIICSICSACLLSLCQPFMQIAESALKQEILLNFEIVILLTLNFYLTSMQTIVVLFKNAKGLFWHDRYRALFSGGINLVLSIILMKKLGIAGVILGTTISTISVDLWFEPYVLFKYGIQYKFRNYIKQYFINILQTIIICIITFYFVNILPSGIIFFIIKGLISFIIPIFMIYVFNFKNKNLKYFVNLLIKKKEERKKR